MDGMDILFLLIPIVVALLLGFVFYMFYQMFTSGHTLFILIQKVIVPKIKPLLSKIFLYQKVGLGLLTVCSGIVFARIFPVSSIPDVMLFVGMAIGMFMLMIATYLRVLMYFFS